MKGIGLTLAAADAPEHAELLENFKEQLLLVFVKRLAKGKPLKIPVQEVDDIGGYNLVMSINQQTKEFIFEVVKKH